MQLNIQCKLHSNEQSINQYLLVSPAVDIIGINIFDVWVTQSAQH